MNPITNALFAGYTGLQILDYVIKKFPHMESRVEQALQAGHTPEQIASHFEKQFQGKASSKKKQTLSEHFGQKQLTDAEKSHARDLRSKREDKLGKTLGMAALGVAGGVAAGSALRAASAARGAQAATPLLGGPGASAQGMPLPGAGPQGPAMGGGAAQAMGGPGAMAQIMKAYQKHLARGGKLSLKSFMNTAAKTVMGNAMGAMAGGQQQAQGQPPMQEQQEPVDVTQEAEWSPMGGTAPPVQPGQPMPDAQAPMQPMPQQMQPQEVESAPPEPSQEVINPEEAAATLENMKLVTKVDNLLQAGNDPEAIKAMINFQLSPGQKKWLADQKLDINQVLDGYLSKPPETSETLANQEKKSRETVELGQNEGEIAPETAESLSKPEPLAAGSTVILPNGVTGKVTGIEGNKVRITDDEGNKKVAPIGHALQPSPMAARFTQAEADDEIARYNASLTPLEKSAPLLYVSYNPTLQQMNVRWGSSPEQSGTYTNVSPETAKKVKDRVTVNKTSGVTGEGVEWEKGEIGKYGSAVIQHVKSVLDDSGALLHPYSVGDVIYNRHERADEAVALANTGKPRQEREEGRAKRAAKAAEKAAKEKERIRKEREKRHKEIQESRTISKLEGKRKAQSAVDSAIKKASEKPPKKEVQNIPKKTQKTVSSFSDLDPKEWEKEGNHRVYFNPRSLARKLGIKVSINQNGKILSAEMNGKKLSNSNAHYYLGLIDKAKVYYDMKTNKFASSDSKDSDIKELLYKLEEEYGK